MRDGRGTYHVFCSISSNDIYSNTYWTYIFLQHYLSNKNKFLGLIIPFVSLLYILAITCTLIPGKEIYSVTINGEETFSFDNKADADRKASSLTEEDYNVNLSSNTNNQNADLSTTIINIIPIIIITIINIIIYILAIKSNKVKRQLS